MANPIGGRLVIQLFLESVAAMITGNAMATVLLLNVLLLVRIGGILNLPILGIAQMEIISGVNVAREQQ